MTGPPSTNVSLSMSHFQIFTSELLGGLIFLIPDPFLNSNLGLMPINFGSEGDIRPSP